MHLATGAASLGIGDVVVAIGQFFEIAIEVESDDFAISVHDRTAGIPTNCVCGVDKVKRCPQRQPIKSIDAALAADQTEPVPLG